ncbi:MAG: two pore domain potassium channel family protein, partial [Acidobacteriota bacterium]|nr:two pore domain potassium channel family protein [Acidobacteriota bacterium]
MPPLIPHPFTFAAGVLLVVLMIVDAFEAIILPRRVTRKIRVARLFYRSTWGLWKAIVGRFPNRKTREALLGGYGPCSLLLLIAIWAFGLVTGFALMQFGAGSAINV